MDEQSAESLRFQRCIVHVNGFSVGFPFGWLRIVPAQAAVRRELARVAAQADLKQRLLVLICMVVAGL